MKIDEVGDRCVRRITRGFLNGRRRYVYFMQIPIVLFLIDS